MTATKTSQAQQASVLGDEAPRVQLTTRVGKKDKSAALESLPVLVIGSRRDCGLPIEQTGVSKIHCAIVNTGSAVFACDLKSRGGTQVNGLRNGLDAGASTHASARYDVWPLEAVDDGGVEPCCRGHADRRLVAPPP